MKFDQATIIWREIEIDLLKKEWGSDLKGKKVLDLGCGEGKIAKEIMGNGVAWGLDNELRMVKKARRSGVYRKVVLGEATKIPLEDGQVEVVFSNSVLEHIGELKQTLVEVSRVLKKGGVLIATMPSDRLVSYIGWGRVYGWLFNRKYRHHHLYSKEKWVELLEGVGLKLVDSYYYLDQETIRGWHKCLWLNRLGIKPRFLSKQQLGKSERLSRFDKQEVGAGIAIKVRKI